MVTDASKGNLVTQVVVCHVYCWSTVRAAGLGSPAGRDHHRAFRGDLIEVTKGEATRGQGLGGLANPADEAEGIAAVNELAEPYPAGAEGDAAIAELDAAEAAGYVGQHPGEAARVYHLEKARKQARKTVLRAMGIDPDEPLPEEFPVSFGGSADATILGAETAAGGPTAVG